MRSEKWSCARRSSRDARHEGPLADDVIRNGFAWLQRNPSVGPAWELGGMIWGQFSANSAVMQRSRNRLASEPPRGSWRERSSRAVIPVIAISVVAGSAITEIDSPHLRGRGRLTGGEPARSCPRNLPPAPKGGNSVGTDVRIWWESGNRTGFPGSQRRVPGDHEHCPGLEVHAQPSRSDPMRKFVGVLGLTVSCARLVQCVGRAVDLSRGAN